MAKESGAPCGGSDDGRDVAQGGALTVRAGMTDSIGDDDSL